MKETQKSPVFSFLFVLFAPFVVSSWGIWGTRGGTKGKCAKRTQFGQSAATLVPASRLCKTKPNLGGMGRLGKGQCHRRGPSPESGMHKTKPIAGGVWRVGDCAKQTQLPEAESRGAVWQPGRCPGADRAKRTQFGAGGRQRAPGHDRAKQSQFRPRQNEGQVVCTKEVMAHRTRNRLRQNKAKLGQAGASGQERSHIWGGRAGKRNVQKRSQIGVVGRPWAVDGCTNEPDSKWCWARWVPGRQMRKTNPIPGRAGWDAATGAGDDCAKRTQFGPAWAGLGRSYDAKRSQFLDGGLGTAESWTAESAKRTQSWASRQASEGGLCKTKPISAFATEQDTSFFFIQPAASGRVCRSVTWGGPLRRSCVLARRLLASGTLALRGSKSRCRPAITHASCGWS